MNVLLVIDMQNDFIDGALGTPEAEKRVTTVLRNDPGMGILRHADAGYETAIRHAKKCHLNLPSIR